MKIKRKIIEIDEELCDGCGNCVPSCAEGALKVVDGKAKLVSEVYCDGLGACLGECPTGALKLTEREAEEFDEEAVEEFLDSKDREETREDLPMARGCPSTQIRSFESTPSQSRLSHWPVQIRLVPPKAPFLKEADLLVAADCTPVAYPHFHRDFLAGKVVMMGCPKFDDVQEYVDRFTEIFKEADIKRVTVLDMEVPCCSALPTIVKKAMEAAGKKVPMEEIVISPKGKILKRENLAA
jgi:ferredoxin